MHFNYLSEWCQTNCITYRLISLMCLKDSFLNCYDWLHGRNKTRITGVWFRPKQLSLFTAAQIKCTMECGSVCQWCKRVLVGGVKCVVRVVWCKTKRYNSSSVSILRERERGLEPAGLNQLQSQAQVLPISHPLQPATHSHTHYTQDTATPTTHRTQQKAEGRNISYL